MSNIVEIEKELFAKNKKRIDLLWVVKPFICRKRKYGRISLKTILFPNKYVGKKFKIRLELQRGK